MTGRLTKHVYIRQGAPPPNGRSRNFEDGSHEAGVSCYDGVLHEDGSYEVIPDNVSQALHSVVFRNQGRPAYVLEGEEVGVGTEGEPVLAVARCTRLPKAFYPKLGGYWEAAVRLVLRSGDDREPTRSEILREMERGPSRAEARKKFRGKKSRSKKKREEGPWSEAWKVAQKGGHP